MTGSESSPFLDALRALRDGLDALGVTWLVIGGVAVIASGVPRYTADIDATLWAPASGPAHILAALRRRAIAPRIDEAVEFARRNRVLLLVHEPSRVPLDVSLAWLPFEDEAIQRGQECDYAGVPIRIPRPDGPGHLQAGGGPAA